MATRARVADYLNSRKGAEKVEFSVMIIHQQLLGYSLGLGSYPKGLQQGFPAKNRYEPEIPILLSICIHDWDKGMQRAGSCLVIAPT